MFGLNYNLLETQRAQIYIPVQGAWTYLSWLKKNYDQGIKSVLLGTRGIGSRSRVFAASGLLVSPMSSLCASSVLSMPPASLKCMSFTVSHLTYKWSLWLLLTFLSLLEWYCFWIFFPSVKWHDAKNDHHPSVGLAGRVDCHKSVPN